MPTHTHQHILQRTVRFTLNTDGSITGHNTTAGKPTMTTLGRYYELQIAVQGTPDHTTGYLLGIQEIDTLVRNTLLPIITAQINLDPSISPSKLLPKLWSTAIAKLTPTLHSIRWHLTPYHSIEMTNQSRDNNTILLRQLYEFSAAHRLHTPALTDQQNADFFGKCNNPSGHGHNYKVQPTIRVPLTAHTPELQIKIEQAVNETIIDPLDHKFLNIDCPSFDQSNEGTIPSVEHITTHCYNQLAPALETLGCTLDQITVWETDRTSATYPA